LVAVTDFVDLLDAANGDVTAAFAEWLCGLVFDRSEFWFGEWGGGFILDGDVWQRPAAPALTVHALSVRVVLPYLIASRTDEGGPHTRWLYQFAVGQGYRLTPREQQRLRSAIEDRCGAGAAPIALLRLAAEDPVAQRMLHDAENED
jgi:hypothetical protein